MPGAYKPKRPQVILALSPAATAAALGLSAATIYSAIQEGRLGPVYAYNSHQHRILTVDIERFVRSWPLAQQKALAHASR